MNFYNYCKEEREREREIDKKMKIKRERVENKEEREKEWRKYIFFKERATTRGSALGLKPEKKNHHPTNQEEGETTLTALAML